MSEPTPMSHSYSGCGCECSIHCVFCQVSMAEARKQPGGINGYCPKRAEAELGKEPDNGRCPGCTKEVMDKSSCFESCPLFKEDHYGDDVIPEVVDSLNVLYMKEVTQ